MYGSGQPYTRATHTCYFHFCRTSGSGRSENFQGTGNESVSVPGRKCSSLSVRSKKGSYERTWR